MNIAYPAKPVAVAATIWDCQLYVCVVINKSPGIHEFVVARNGDDKIIATAMYVTESNAISSMGGIKWECMGRGFLCLCLRHIGKVLDNPRVEAWGPLGQQLFNQAKEQIDVGEKRMFN